MVKRAITLGGGGPAAGLHIGVLEALAEDKTLAEGEKDKKFDVWALSCIGAWVGIVYNQFKEETVKEKNKSRAELTYEFFRDGVFRDDEGYKRFPINTVFGPDWNANMKAFQDFVTNPDNYTDFRWQPYKAMEYVRDSMSFWRLPPGERSFEKWDEGDINNWILNQVLAPNPFVRYLTSLMYLSNVNGLSRINYPDSKFMKSINFKELKEKGKPHIFHNAWNLDKQKLALFSNRPFQRKLEKDYEYKEFIDARTLCACSALPFIEGTVEIDKVTYCEGALVDTVNFESLLEEHPDLDEIWVSRIVDSQQIRKPNNLHDALANLCQLFAATVGEDDVRLFKYHVKEADLRDKHPDLFDKYHVESEKKLKKASEDGKNRKKEPWRGIVVEIHVPGHINFNWNHSNLENSRKLGYEAAKQAIGKFNEKKPEIDAKKKGNKGKLPEPVFINENPQDDPDWRDLRDSYQKKGSG